LNARGVAVSHDGKSLYVTADGSVASFDIASDGSITQKAGLAGCVSEVAGCTTGYGMHGGIGGGALALAPDDSQLLRTDTLDSALALLGRTSDGVLSQSSDGSGCLRMAGTPFCDTARAIASAEDVAISPDGRSVYVTSPAADAVAIFDRDPGGTLTQKPGAAGCISDDGAAGCATGRALGGAGRIAIPADGKSVYITGSEGNSIVIFDRAPNGVLTQRSGTAGCVASTGAGGCAPARALAGATAITISPDQTNLYVSSVTGDSIAVFDRDADGSLTQKDGPAGCVNATGEEGCTKGNLLDGIYDLALSPDGSSLYATAFFANALLVFDRAPDLPDPPDNLPPELKKLKLKPNRFKAAKKGPSVTVKGKPKVSFNLGETATVRFSVERALSGRRAGKRCVKPTRANRAKKHCTRYRKLRGSFTREGTTGANSFRFTGRLAGHSLKPGRYRLTAVATDGTGNRSQPAKVRFSILRRR
jgi:DNA-binding beta-propeller fold protein YncE